MCTRVLWGDANGAVLVGRNMDYHRDLATNLWKLPRGIKRDDGVNGALSWTARYGSVAITALDMMTVDGLNEAGLSGHILWLAESVIEGHCGTAEGIECPHPADNRLSNVVVRPQ